MSYSPTTRILNQYISRGITTVEEIAQILSTSKSRIYKVLEGENQLWAEDIRVLSEYFSNMGHNELAGLFKGQKWGFIPTGECSIDGCLLSENAEMSKLKGRLLELFEKRNKEQGLRACDDLIAIATQVKSEFKNLD